MSLQTLFWSLPVYVQTVLGLLAFSGVVWVVWSLIKLVWLVVLLAWNLLLILWHGLVWLPRQLVKGLTRSVNATDDVYRRVKSRTPTRVGPPAARPVLRIAVPEVQLSKKIALRTRAEWNRNRDRIAPYVLARDEWYCQWCDQKLDEDNWSIDHIIPISKGGTNEIHNLQAMCRSCNSIKGVKSDSWGKFWNKVVAA